ncbi:hypothetical protein [Bacillus subtilis]|uniref:hypothetical protein n=1 Tax=Bacillus subtilis TaxID=1423 RepID=UPI001BCB2D03|nr:hypothetical protein [Bacillus subtilis]
MAMSATLSWHLVLVLRMRLPEDPGYQRQGTTDALGHVRHLIPGILPWRTGCAFLKILDTNGRGQLTRLAMSATLSWHLVLVLRMRLPEDPGYQRQGTTDALGHVRHLIPGILPWRTGCAFLKILDTNGRGQLTRLAMSATLSWHLVLVLRMRPFLKDCKPSQQGGNCVHC